MLCARRQVRHTSSSLLQLVFFALTLISNIFSVLALNACKLEEERLRIENEKLKKEVEMLKERLVQAETDNGGKLPHHCAHHGKHNFMSFPVDLFSMQCSRFLYPNA